MTRVSGGGIRERERERERDHDGGYEKEKNPFTAGIIS